MWTGIWTAKRNLNLDELNINYYYYIHDNNTENTNAETIRTKKHSSNSMQKLSTCKETT